MPPRAPKKRRVKSVSANAVQTQAKSRKKDQPSNEDLMNPESIHFTPDWWTICEILDDPWASIVADFQWSEMIINDAEDRLTGYRDMPIGHFPESNSPIQRLEFALNTIYKTSRDIEDKISYKTVDAEFVLIWGEYQKAVAMLMGAIPEYDRHREINLHSESVSKNKAEARQWYALWYEWYKRTRKPNRVSRAMFNKYFCKLLQSMRLEERTLPKDKIHFLTFLENFLSDPKDKENVELTAFFTSKFFGDEVTKAMELGLKNTSLPLVGEEHYKLKR